MMATTHGLIGLTAATILATVAPGPTEHIALAGFIGGIVPDIDVAFNHRKTTHFPIALPALAILSLIGAALWTTPATLITAALLTGAALHCITDVLGGDFSERPWKQDGDIAVYDHVRSQWLPAKRYIRYDGAPEDLLLYLVLSIPLMYLYSAPFRTLIIVGAAISITYTAFRKDFLHLTPGPADQSIDPDDIVALLRNGLAERSQAF